jgi:hypothetical protein
MPDSAPALIAGLSLVVRVGLADTATESARCVIAAGLNSVGVKNAQSLVLPVVDGEQRGACCRCRG